jgi:manganese/zinc/iron transport system permease protein
MVIPQSLWHYLTDPVLQAPTIASMLMCLSSALIGVIVFLRRRSLLGEALSHASYPGVVISIFITAVFFPAAHDALALIILIGGFCTSLIALWLIEKMERSWKVKNDAALCFVLSIFFGVGVLFASQLQFSHALWYQTAHLFLYGQAATMTDIHIVLYAALSALIITVLFFLYHSLRIAIFDRDYGKTVGVPIKAVDAIVFFLLILAIIIGIRSVGVVLMAGMLIAPAIAARQFTDRLKTVFILAGLIGAFSGFFGNYLSVEIPEWGRKQGWEWKFSLPTGPMILLTASGICLLSLLLAPKSGFVRRRIRAAHFQRECQRENALKYMWKMAKNAEERPFCFSELKAGMAVSSFQLFWMLFFLKNEGWIAEKERRFSLTSDGWQRASRIIRLHRLWEVYLVHLGQGVEKVHRSAEEMEHILTPELEQELTLLLDNPQLDPHEQPIPSKALFIKGIPSGFAQTGKTPGSEGLS